MSLKGAVVYVAGGSGIVGGSAVKACLQAGARVWLSGRSNTRFEEFKSTVPAEFHSNLEMTTCDMGDEKDAERLKNEILAKDGKVNHVVCSIGGWREDGPLSKVSFEAYRNAMKDMAVPHFLCYKTFAPELQKHAGSTYTFITGGSSDHDIPFHVSTAGMIPPTTGHVYGLYASAECENKEVPNLSIMQLRIYIMISKYEDDDVVKNGKGLYRPDPEASGHNFIGRFFPKAMSGQRSGLYKFESRAAVNKIVDSL